MGKKESGFRREWIKIKKIPGFKKKADYLREYYGLWFIFVAAIVFLGGYGAWRYRSAIRENQLYITFANTYADIGTRSGFWNDFLSYSEYDTRKANVIFNNASYFKYGEFITGNTYFETFVAYEEAGTLDAITMEPDALIPLGESGRLMDLDSEACSNLKKKYHDRFIYCTPYDKEYSKDKVPVGIDISDSMLMSQYHIYAKNCAIGIGAKAQHIEAIEKFLDYVMEEDSLCIP